MVHRHKFYEQLWGQVSLPSSLAKTLCLESLAAHIQLPVLDCVKGWSLKLSHLSPWQERTFFPGLQPHSLTLCHSTLSLILLILLIVAAFRPCPGTRQLPSGHKWVLSVQAVVTEQPYGEDKKHPLGWKMNLYSLILILFPVLIRKYIFSLFSLQVCMIPLSLISSTILGFPKTFVVIVVAGLCPQHPGCLASLCPKIIIRTLYSFKHCLAHYI